jgi:hypothetical protein
MAIKQAQESTLSKPQLEVDQELLVVVRFFPDITDVTPKLLPDQVTVEAVIYYKDSMNQNVLYTSHNAMIRAHVFNVTRQQYFRTGDQNTNLSNHAYEYHISVPGICTQLLGLCNVIFDIQLVKFDNDIQSNHVLFGYDADVLNILGRMQNLICTAEVGIQVTSQAMIAQAFPITPSAFQLVSEKIVPGRVQLNCLIAQNTALTGEFNRMKFMILTLTQLPDPDLQDDAGVSGDELVVDIFKSFSEQLAGNQITENQTAMVTVGSVGHGVRNHQQQPGSAVLRGQHVPDVASWAGGYEAHASQERQSLPETTAEVAANASLVSVSGANTLPGERAPPASGSDGA